MSAYVIADIEVTDPVEYEEYKKLASATIALYGGRYLARAGKTEVLEGTWNPKRLVILEFDSMERALSWLNSPEYCRAKKIRHGAAISNLVAINGIN